MFEAFQQLPIKEFVFGSSTGSRIVLHGNKRTLTLNKEELFSSSSVNGIHYYCNFSSASIKFLFYTIDFNFMVNKNLQSEAPARKEFLTQNSMQKTYCAT